HRVALQGDKHVFLCDQRRFDNRKMVLGESASERLCHPSFGLWSHFLRRIGALGSCESPDPLCKLQDSTGIRNSSLCLRRLLCISTQASDESFYSHIRSRSTVAVLAYHHRLLTDGRDRPLCSATAYER